MIKRMVRPLMVDLNLKFRWQQRPGDSKDNGLAVDGRSEFKVWLWIAVLNLWSEARPGNL